MADLDVIAETLRLQRADIDEMLDETLSRSSETAALVDKIGELRQRSEETLRRFREAGIEKESKEPGPPA